MSPELNFSMGGLYRFVAAHRSGRRILDGVGSRIAKPSKRRWRPPRLVFQSQPSGALEGETQRPTTWIQKVWRVDCDVRSH